MPPHDADSSVSSTAAVPVVAVPDLSISHGPPTADPSADPRYDDLAQALAEGGWCGPVMAGPPELEIFGSTIREALRSPHTGMAPDPRGLRMQGLRIIGELILDDLTIGFPVHFENCHFTSGLTLRRAKLHSFHLRGCSAERKAGSVLRGSGSTVAHDLEIEGTFTANSDAAAIDLVNAQVTGDLTLGPGTVVENRSARGSAVLASGITVGGKVTLNGKYMDHSSSGTVNFDGAHVHGDFSAHAGVTNANGSAVSVNGAIVGGTMQLSGILAGSGTSGAIGVEGTSVGARFWVPASTIAMNHSGPALRADLLTARTVFIDGTLIASDPYGGVRMVRSQIEANVELRDADLINFAGPALTLDGATVKGIAQLSRVRCVGRGWLGTVSLNGTHVDGELRALGRHRLMNLDLSSSPALDIDVSVARARKKWRMIDETEKWRLDLQPWSELVDDQLVRRDDGSSPVFETASPEVAPPPTLNLARAMIGTLSLAVDYGGSGPWLSIAGATYSGQPQVADKDAQLRNQHFGPVPRRLASAEEWMELLSLHTVSYDAFSWQQLAAVHRSAGHELDAKRILIAQQDDRRRRLLRAPASAGRRDRMRLGWHRTGLAASRRFTGYGYRSGRAMAWLAGVVLVATSLSVVGGSVPVPVPKPSEQVVGRVYDQFAVSRGRFTTDPGGSCTVSERIGLGFDIAVPFLRTGARDRCTFSTSTSNASWFYYVSLLLQVLGWAFATLVVAGYTGLIRRL